jgi:hypothetical protein
VAAGLSLTILPIVELTKWLICRKGRCGPQISAG